MVLSSEDAERFYNLWFPLLDYVNKQKGISTKLRNIRRKKNLDPNEVVKVAEALWADPSVIDDYLKNTRDEISERDRELIRSWKRRVSGQFIVERILKKGAILLSDDKVYQVSGIMSSWDELLRFTRCPAIIEATLIPFENVIIPDGLLHFFDVAFGPGSRELFRDEYMSAKESGKIIRQL